MIRRGAVVPRPLYFNLGNPPLLLLPRRPQFQMRNYPFFGINGRPMYRVRSSIGPDGNGIANRFCPVSHFQRNRLVSRLSRISPFRFFVHDDVCYVDSSVRPLFIRFHDVFPKVSHFRSNRYESSEFFRKFLRKIFIFFFLFSLSFF